MKIPTQEEFTLKMLKYLDKSFEIQGTANYSSDGQQKERNYDQDSSTILPHADLKAILKSWDKKLADTYGFTNEQTKKVACTGCITSGTDESFGLKLTGKYEMPSGNVVSINSHKIFFSQEYYGWHKELQEEWELMQIEGYAYIFEDKQEDLQLSMEEKGSE